MELANPLLKDEDTHPLDVLEAIAGINDWSWEREDDEITIAIPGNNTTYEVSFSWINGLNSVHLAAAFEFRPPRHRLAEVETLIARINEQLWIGHFDIWVNDGVTLFRHAHILSDNELLSPDTAHILLSTAIESCDQYYPAFQHIAWSDCTAEHAIRSILFETIGEA